MKLFTRTQGDGPDLVLLHGWGLHGEVWSEVAPALAAHYRVTLIDLPGHGRSTPLDGAGSLHALTQQVLDAAPPAAAWLGWSLGGMIALHAAFTQPQRLTRLVAVAATPRFVQAPDWPHAVETRLLDDFALALTCDYRATVQRFVALQTRGAPHARAQLRALNAQLFSHGEPDPAALRAGLEVLRGADLRGEICAINCPTLLIGAEHDKLVPVAALKNFVLMLPAGRLHIIGGAGHAPFLSHAREFIRTVKEFLDETIAGNRRAGPPSPQQKFAAPRL